MTAVEQQEVMDLANMLINLSPEQLEAAIAYITYKLEYGEEPKKSMIQEHTNF